MKQNEVAFKTKIARRCSLRPHYFHTNHQKEKEIISKVDGGKIYTNFQRQNLIKRKYCSSKGITKLRKSKTWLESRKPTRVVIGKPTVFSMIQSNRPTISLQQQELLQQETLSHSYSERQEKWSSQLLMLSLLPMTKRRDFYIIFFWKRKRLVLKKYCLLIFRVTTKVTSAPSTNILQ